MPTLDVTIVGKMILPEVSGGPIIPPGQPPSPGFPSHPIYWPPVISGGPGSLPPYPMPPIAYPPGIWGPPTMPPGFWGGGMGPGVKPQPPGEGGGSVSNPIVGELPPGWLYVFIPGIGWVPGYAGHPTSSTPPGEGEAENP